jgi:hypothetical protein
VKRGADGGGEKPGIILVGVVHGDPEGYDRLKKFLHLVRPRVISVEISEYSWRYRRNREVPWQRQFQLSRQSLLEEQRRHVALEKVAAQIACPFEVRAAEDYARGHGVGWQAVDLNSVAREHLPRYEAELLSQENLGSLVLTPDGDWGEHIRQEYQRARMALQTGRGSMINMLGGELSPQASMREKVLAHRVARLAKQWLRVVHVSGWEHLVMSGPRKTMADFLAAWRPRRVLLDDI